jgi:predicted enzyme related to lactoylglutathione lyase
VETNKHPTLSNGKICYIEIPAIDINASVSFYQDVFAWQIRQRGDGSIAFDDAVGQVSGTWVLGRRASTEPGLLIYIMVDSVATTIDVIIAKGGRIVQPIGMDAPEVTARFSDPAGNIIGLYQEPGNKAT